MSFVTLQRLVSARKVLIQNPDDGMTLSRIAMENGFSSPGRFSEIYRRTYGENPSVTRRTAQR
jgi:transcriptional regulator GlxA family with amidase domain